MLIFIGNIQGDTMVCISAHVGIPSQTVDIGDCGISNSYEGVVFDAWPFPMLDS
jgi:hypothetical protein